jgi:acetyl esterase/lipase
MASDGAAITLHWFTPPAAAGTSDTSDAGAAIIHAHGGALVAGEVAHFAPFIGQYVGASGVPFLSVEYRLAPEVTGSTPGDDVYTGLTWLREHAAELGVDPNRIAVMGESAGSTLAAAAAIRATQESVPLARQILIYPMLDNREAPLDEHLVPFSADLHTLKHTGWISLLGDAHADDQPSTIVPAQLADFTGLPAAYLEVGELDAFRDETVTYAQRLWAAGVSTELHVLPGLNHGWDHFAPGISIRAEVFARRISILRSL